MKQYLYVVLASILVATLNGVAGQGCKTVAEIIDTQDDLTSFSSFIKDTDLSQQFAKASFKGSVFAPSNFNIQQLLRIEPSLSEKSDLIEELLKYHVADAAVTEFSKTKKANLTSLLKPTDDLLCDKTAGDVDYGVIQVQGATGDNVATVWGAQGQGGKGKIVKSYEACNAMVYQINTVLFPCSIQEVAKNLVPDDNMAGAPDGEGAADSPAPTAAVDTNGCRPLMQVAEENDLGLYTVLVSAAGYETLGNFEGMAVIPTDKAIQDALDRYGIDLLDKDQQPIAQALLAYHLSYEEVITTGMDGSKQVKTLLSAAAVKPFCYDPPDTSLTFVVDGRSDLTIKTGNGDKSAGLDTDLAFCGGVVHIVDALLTPCELDEKKVKKGAIDDDSKTSKELADELEKADSKRSEKAKRNEITDSFENSLAPGPVEFGSYDITEPQDSAKEVESRQKEKAIAKRFKQQLKQMEAQIIEPVVDRPDNCADRWNSAWNLLSADEDLSLFRALIDAANLTEAFANPGGNFTVFAPSNRAVLKAFQYYGMTPWDMLTEVDKGDSFLRAMVAYHVVPRELRQADIIKNIGQRYKTVMKDLDGTNQIWDSPCSGTGIIDATFQIVRDMDRSALGVQGGFTIAQQAANGIAFISKFDREACGAMLHKIEGFMWPCDFKGPRCGALAGALGDEEEVSVFAAELKRLKGYDMLDVALHATIFAPLDQGWADLFQENNVKDLPSTSVDFLYDRMMEDFVKYHVAIGQAENPIVFTTTNTWSQDRVVSFGDHREGKKIETLAETFYFCEDGNVDNTLVAYPVGDRVEIQAGANRVLVVGDDIEACNSIIHKVQKVLMPCQLKPPNNYTKETTQEAEPYSGLSRDFANDVNPNEESSGVGLCGSAVIGAALAFAALRWGRDLEALA